MNLIDLLTQEAARGATAIQFRPDGIVSMINGFGDVLVFTKTDEQQLRQEARQVGNGHIELDDGRVRVTIRNIQDTDGRDHTYMVLVTMWA